MKTLNALNKSETRNINGGWDTCAICHEYVPGSAWDKYWHCVKHSYEWHKPVITILWYAFRIASFL